MNPKVKPIPEGFQTITPHTRDLTPEEIQEGTEGFCEKAGAQ